MEQLSPDDRPESPEERRQRRRVRRWKRRARMIGPFLGVTAVLATLALSVDLIEYQPEPPKERLTDRPIPEAVLEKEREREEPAVGTTSLRTVPSSLSAASVLTGDRIAGAGLIGDDAAPIDVSLAAEAALPGDRPVDRRVRNRDLSAPTPPSALRSGR